MRLGIPYAHKDIETDEHGNSVLISVCPRCGERIPEATDEYGELAGKDTDQPSAYALHWDDRHSEDED